eukprot:c4356_g1_i1.p1 GENE.c4356_g1_i1~~c4356_g1_i1.p1  ORF type:complete len:239 (+),score=72.77 c4356_g1_i1:39-719(+)
MSDQLFAELDAFSNSHKAQEGYEAAKNALAAHPDNVDVLWRAARAIYEWAASQQEGTAEKKALVLEAAEVGKKALDLAPERWETNKWAAITIGRKGDYADTKEKIQNAFLIKEWATKALEKHPDDWTLNHVLGMWHFQIASTGFIQRQIASALFATPPTSTYEEAIPFLEKADQLFPNPRSRFSLGETYEKLGNKAKATEWYAKSLEVEAASQEGKDLQEQARKKI